MIGEPPLKGALPVNGGMAVWPRAWHLWMTQAWQILFALSQSGLTAARPTERLYTGQMFFDTTLGTPIWWDGSQWVDSAGAPA